MGASADFLKRRSPEIEGLRKDPLTLENEVLADIDPFRVGGLFGSFWDELELAIELSRSLVLRSLLSPTLSTVSSVHDRSALNMTTRRYAGQMAVV